MVKNKAYNFCDLPRCRLPGAPFPGCKLSRQPPRAALACLRRCAAFYDGPMLLTSLNVVKNFVLLGDVAHSVQFVRYKDEVGAARRWGGRLTGVAGQTFRPASLLAGHAYVHTPRGCPRSERLSTQGFPRQAAVAQSTDLCSTPVAALGLPTTCLPALAMPPSAVLPGAPHPTPHAPIYHHHTHTLTPNPETPPRPGLQGRQLSLLSKDFNRAAVAATQFLINGWVPPGCRALPNTMPPSRASARLYARVFCHVVSEPADEESREARAYNSKGFLACRLPVGGGEGWGGGGG